MYHNISAIVSTSIPWYTLIRCTVCVNVHAGVRDCLPLLHYSAVDIINTTHRCTGDISHHLSAHTTHVLLFNWGQVGVCRYPAYHNHVHTCSSSPLYNQSLNLTLNCTIWLFLHPYVSVCVWVFSPASSALVGLMPPFFSPPCPSEAGLSVTLICTHTLDCSFSVQIASQACATICKRQQ